MGISYNPFTAVPQNNEIKAKQEYNYNYKPVIYSASSTTTQTVEEDFILTTIYFYSGCADTAGVSSANMTVTVLGQTFPGVLAYGDTSTGVSIQGYVPIPNWFIPAGTPLQFIFFGNPATGWGNISLIGFLL